MRHNSHLNKPKLTVIAGCNGSGKSTYSDALVGPDLVSFDFDLCYKRHYDSLFDFDIRDKMAYNLAFEEMVSKISYAINHRQSFSFETNFNSTPLHWPSKFKESGYYTHLIFLVLNSVEVARKRVAIRVENGGGMMCQKKK